MFVFHFLSLSFLINNKREEDEIVVDRDNILLSCESLLDFGTELNFEKRHLDFHYRF